MKKRNAFSKLISYLLVCAMVITLIPSNIALVTAKAAETEELTTMLTDLVEVEVDGVRTTMKLANKGYYECRFEGKKNSGSVSDDSVSDDSLSSETTAETKTVDLYINNEKQASKQVSFGEEDVYLSLKDGSFQSNAEWTVKSAALVGNFD